MIVIQCHCTYLLSTKGERTNTKRGLCRSERSEPGRDRTRDLQTMAEHAAQAGEGVVEEVQGRTIRSHRVVAVIYQLFQALPKKKTGYDVGYATVKIVAVTKENLRK